MHDFLKYSLVLLAVLSVIGLFDKGLAVGFLLLLFLLGLTFFVLFKFGVKDKEIFIVIFVFLIIHLAAMLFIHYVDFNPFGGGADYEGYHKSAVEIASRFSRLNFSLQGIFADHFFPVLIGILYMLTMPNMLVGQFFVLWLGLVSAFLLYFLVLEIGGNKKTALFAGIILTLYPSYLFFGSILLKDTVVIPLVLAGMIFFVKMLKEFFWIKFLIFFAILVSLIDLRFYMGYALMFSFITCWFFFSGIKLLKDRFAYGLVIILILGAAPQIVGNGYYGSKDFKQFLIPETITFYREIAYKPRAPVSPAKSPQLENPSPVEQKIEKNSPIQKTGGNDSSFEVEVGLNKGPLVFFLNYTKSFIYSLIGPLPWQFKYNRQYISLIETIPWYILLALFFLKAIKFVKRQGFLEFLNHYRFAIPLLVFGLMALGALSLFINNYGIIVRIRIPMFLCFLSAMLIIFNSKIEILYEKIYSYGRSWIYRQPSR